ncbi:uncharacterized protein [Rutidosis leptorrhynchoides]|uniref:uncharacterized protein isoform X1 n=1 Tax=Rutidosis leptorrhynchoides TaxID=125765 RepID=UPI003A99FBE4
MKIVVYDLARVGDLGGPDSILAQPRGNLERPSVMAEDRYPNPLPSIVESPPVSTGAYGTNLTGVGQTCGSQQVNPDKWRGKIGQSTGMEEDPFAPNPTRAASPVVSVTHDPTTYDTKQVFDSSGKRGHDVNQGQLRGVMGKSTGMVPDPHAPTDKYRMDSDPSNYESKVTDPTHTGGKKAGLSQIRHSLDKLSIHHDPNHPHPEHPPHGTLTEKISSSASVIAEKAAVAKDVIVHKLGYSGHEQHHHTTGGSHVTVHHPPPGSHGHVHHSSVTAATEYAHKITDKVTETLAPVYEKVVDAGSSVIHKVHDTVAGTGTGTGTHHQHVVHRGAEHMKGDADKGGVSVKEYLVETLKPGDEDKELSDVITHALHGENQQELEKKGREDRRPAAMGRVTESIGVRTRLGTDRPSHHQQQQHSDDVTANKNVTERLSEAVGSFFGGKGDAPQATSGTSYVTDEGLSSNPRGDQK